MLHLADNKNLQSRICGKLRYNNHMAQLITSSKVAQGLPYALQCVVFDQQRGIMLFIGDKKECEKFIENCENCVIIESSGSERNLK